MGQTPLQAQKIFPTRGPETSVSHVTGYRKWIPVRILDALTLQSPIGNSRRLYSSALLDVPVQIHLRAIRTIGNSAARGGVVECDEVCGELAILRDRSFDLIKKWDGKSGKYHMKRYDNHMGKKNR